MAIQNSTQARLGIDHAPLLSLSDGDLARHDSRAAKARATTLVPDVDRLARQLLTEFRAAWSASDESRMAEVIVDAIELDDAHRGGPRLMDEIRGFKTPADGRTERLSAADRAAHAAASHIRRYSEAA